MNTTENNKLIAEFLGYEFIDGDFKVPHADKTNNSDFKEWCPTYWDNDLDSGGYLVVPCNLMFHLDWNWLMEVVEKIESLEYNVEFSKNHCIIIAEIEKVDSKRITKYSEIKIKAVYNACVEFIKWYNEQNK